MLTLYIEIGVKGWGSSVERRRENKKISQEERQEKKQAILAALAKVSDDSQLLEDNDMSAFEPDDYYILSRDEMDALVNGDMEKLEGWVSNMDRTHATRLLHWLIKERW
jgi:sarcosine oxidase gamma subunit